jgi:hypothetical protein
MISIFANGSTQAAVADFYPEGTLYIDYKPKGLLIGKVKDGTAKGFTERAHNVVTRTWLDTKFLKPVEPIRLPTYHVSEHGPKQLAALYNILGLEWERPVGVTTIYYRMGHPKMKLARAGNFRVPVYLNGLQEGAIRRITDFIGGPIGRNIPNRYSFVYLKDEVFELIEYNEDENT